MMRTRDIGLFATVLFLGLRTWDLGWYLLTAFLSMTLILFCSHLLGMQPVYRIPGYGTRALYYD